MSHHERENGRFENDNRRLEGLEIEDSRSRSPLPSPAIASLTTSKPKASLSSSTIIPIWIILSSSVIIYNNHIYNTLNFKYPVFLVTWHLTFAVSVRLCSPGLVMLRRLLTGYWDPCLTTNNELTRWCQRCTYLEANIHSVHTTYRFTLQR